MICSPKFIQAYNTIFKELDKQGLLERFWDGLAENMFDDLAYLAKTQGLQGCYKYWNKTLTEEKAKFTLHLIGNTLTLTMTECPSIKILDNPCERYCEHCNYIYRKILEPLGFKYDIAYKGRGKCQIIISR
jgi:hypothetical protein